MSYGYTHEYTKTCDNSVFYNNKKLETIKMYTIEALVKKIIINLCNG